MVQPFQSPQHRGGVGAHRRPGRRNLAISSTFQSPQHRGGVAHGGLDHSGLGRVSLFQSPQHRGGVAHARRSAILSQRCEKVSIPSAPGRSRARRHRARQLGSACGFNPLSTGAESRTARDLLEPAMDEAGVSIPSAPGRSRRTRWMLSTTSQVASVSIPSAPGRSAHAELAEWDDAILAKVSIPSAPGRSRALGESVRAFGRRTGTFQSPQHRGGVCALR